MATLQELESAFLSAHNAGDKAAAQALADEVRRMRASAPAPAPVPPPAAPAGTPTGLPSTLTLGMDSDTVGNVVRGAGDAFQNLYHGAKQLGASAFGSEETKARLGAEAAAMEKEQAAAPTSRKVGRVGTDIATAFLPGGAATKAVTFLPKVARFMQGLGGAGKLAATTAGAAGTGAGFGLLNPEENYDPLQQAKEGAAWGAGGNIVGAGVGKLWAPMTKGSKAAQEEAAALELMGMPKPSWGTTSDSPAVRAATNALEQIPFFGGKVTKNREANLEYLTEAATAGTGSKMKQITPEARADLVDRLNQTAQTFRIAETAPVAGVAAEAKAALARVEDYAKATSQKGKADKLKSVEAAATPKPTGILGPTGQPIPGPPVTRTADELMDLRRAASEIAYKETDPVLAAQYRQIRDAYDEALRTALNKRDPDLGAKFDLWRRQWGQTEDVLRAADKGTEGGRLKSAAVASEFLPKGVTQYTPKQRFIAAMENAVPQPPTGWNRALITSLLMGSVPGVASGIASGDPLVGLAVGGGTLGLGRHALTANPKTAKAQAEMLRKLLANTAIAGGT